MRLCEVYYILLYYLLIQAATVESLWWPWTSSSEEIVGRYDLHIGPNYLKITCVALMNKYSDVYWRIWNKEPRNFFEGVSACSKVMYYKQEGQLQYKCELEVETSKLRGHTFTCHAGALSKDLYKLPDVDNDWWSAPIFIQGTNDNVAYTPSAEVEATCIVDVSAKLYPADYAAQWLLINDPSELAPTIGSGVKNNGTNSATLGMTTSESVVKELRVQLNYVPSSDDDGKYLVCRCWHLKVLEECGHKNVKLKLRRKVLGGNDSVMKNVTITDLDAESLLDPEIKKSDSLTFWLSLGVVVASIALLISVTIFSWKRFKTSKKTVSQSREELYADIKKLYTVPIRKSQRIQKLTHDIPLQRIESEVYDSPYSEDYVYVYSEFEDNSHIYGNFPVLISNSLPRRAEPVYANP